MIHIPVRNCAACRVKLPKKELYRIVRTPDGVVKFDPTGKSDGRGLYWCGKQACLHKIRKKGLVGRFLGIQPSETLFISLEEVLTGH